MKKEETAQHITQMHKYFSTQNTKDVLFRLKQLKQLNIAIRQYEHKIAEALWKDLHKSFEEAFYTEFSLVYDEINYHIKNLERWAKPQRVSTPLPLIPSQSKIITEPLGVCLILSPWNYPLQLVINPLIGAISAGCCAVLKPSHDTPYFSEVIEELISQTFDGNYIKVFKGGIEESEILLQQHFNCIFFTGSTTVGKIIMKAAAENLTPVVLELGGKSPCIVDKDADVERAAKRIAWGKTINAGQTCIAPDYLLVHEQVKKPLLEKMERAFKEMYGNDPQQSPYYSRIIHAKAFERLRKYLLEGQIVYGGKTDAIDNYIQPTILDNVSIESSIMKDEIFGPILPVFTFTHLAEVEKTIQLNPTPLALYYFGNKKTGNVLFSKISFGGGCINDTLLHIGNNKLPFGGVGNSGMGKYHGKNSFLIFSNQKSVIESSVSFDLPFKYAPYKLFKWIKRIVS